jgi:hypothetical protein
VLIRKTLLFILLFALLDVGVSLVIRGGLYRYFGLGTDTSVALIGHSHLMLGIDKELMESKIGTFVSKYTREGVNVADRYVMIRQLVDLNPETKLVVYGVDAWMFTGEGLSENSYKLFYPFMDQPDVKAFIRSNAAWPEYLQHLVVRSSRFDEMLVSGAARGYLGNWSNLKFGQVDTSKLTADVQRGAFRHIRSDGANRRMFEESLGFLTSRGIQVVLVYVPTIGLYNRAQPELFAQELVYLRGLEAHFDGVHYLEYLEGWEDRSEYFFDPIHLNPQGQQRFTEAFINDLLKLKDIQKILL